MLYIIKNAVYVLNSGSYVKCVLHRKGNQYYLVSTKVLLDKLPKDYEVMTFAEVVAKYRDDAVDDDVKEA